MRHLVFILLLIFSNLHVFAQTKSEDHSFANIELMFSYSNFNNNKLRFSVFPNFNIPLYILIGRNNTYLIETGINIRNIGIIYEDSIKHKVRAIAFGVPIKFSVPKLPILLTTELNFNFFEKEKIFYENNTIKEKTFIPKKTNFFQPAVSIEVYIHKLLRIKGGYSINNFFNNDYNTIKNGSIYFPYENKSNIFSLSIIVSIVNGSNLPSIIRIK